MYRLFECDFYKIYMFGGVKFNRKYHWFYIAVGDKKMIKTGKRADSWSLIDVNHIATRALIREGSNSYIDTWLRILARWYRI